jgi:uncharacterized protein (TIGR02145 family)
MEVTQLIIDGVTIPALDNTDALPEGDTNLYFTAAREAALQAQIDFIDSMNTVLASTIDNLLNQLYDPATSTTTAATPVVATTATLTATFDDGGAEAEVAGFIFSTSPTLSDSTVYTVSPGSGSMSHALSGLTKGTTYYYKAFVETIMGRAEGNVQSFTTIDDPEVTTLEVLDAAQTSATLRGNITSDGGGTISASGFRFGTTANLTSTTNVPSTATSGVYSEALTGLEMNETFYFHAYVTNESGTVSGDTLSFATVGPCQNVFAIDYLGHTYNLKEYGDACWFLDNLKALTLSDAENTPILPYTLGQSSGWHSGAATPYYALHEHAPVDPHGAVYNWYAVASGHLCPSGWHVPSDQEWKNLEMHLGMTSSQANASLWRGTDQGTQMKSTSTDPLPMDGTNSSEFSANRSYTLMNGQNLNGNEGLRGRYHSSTKYGFEMVMRFVEYGKSGVFRQTDSNISTYGGYVRCVKD